MYLQNTGKNKVIFKNQALCVLLLLIILPSALLSEEINMLINLDLNRIVYFHSSLPDSVFPAGSIIKPFIIIALNKDRLLDYKKIVICKQAKANISQFKRCWFVPGHGYTTLKKAIAVSCNNYFREIAKPLNFKTFQHTLKEFNLFNSSIKKPPDKIYSSAIIGIGNYILLNPIKVLLAYIAIFKNGELFSIAEDMHHLIFLKKISINSKVRKLLLEGLKEASVSGTAFPLKKKNYFEVILCKTGTASWYYNNKSDYRKNHGWFIGIFKKNSFTYGILVFQLIGTGLTAQLRALEIINKVLKNEF